MTGAKTKVVQPSKVTPSTAPLSVKVGEQNLVTDNMVEVEGCINSGRVRQE